MNRDVIVQTQQHLLWFVVLSFLSYCLAAYITLVNSFLLSWDTAVHCSVCVSLCVQGHACEQKCVRLHVVLPHKSVYVQCVQC